MLLSHHSLLFFYVSICFGITFSSATNLTIHNKEQREHIRLLQDYAKGDLSKQVVLDAGITIIPDRIFTSFSSLMVSPTNTKCDKHVIITSKRRLDGATVEV